MKRITADEARRRQNDDLMPKVDEDRMKEIYQSISVAADTTLDTYIWYYQPISLKMKRVLEKDGYVVEDRSDSKEGVLYKISWADEKAYSNSHK